MGRATAWRPGRERIRHRAPAVAEGVTATGAEAVVLCGRCTRIYRRRRGFNSTRDRSGERLTAPPAASYSGKRWGRAI